MKILIDMDHPLDVHFFKNAIREWKRRGHEILVAARQKDVTLQLLRAYEIEFRCLSTQGRGLLGLAQELIVRDWRLYRMARAFQPDIFIGFTGLAAAHAALLLGKPSIVFSDTEFARLSHLLAYPFASTVCTPSCYADVIGPKQVRFSGYKELAYLHPRRFRPDPAVARRAGVDPESRFFVVRFVSWGAAHDVAEKGLDNSNKVKFVGELAKHGRVLISSEGALAPELRRYASEIPVQDMHDVMAFATLYVGESATMASESAVLGVPAIFIAKTDRGYTTEQERKYGLVFNFTDAQQERAFHKMIELLAQPGLKDEWQRRRERMLAEQVDVSEWLIDFVENYNDESRRHLMGGVETTGAR